MVRNVGNWVGKNNNIRPNAKIMFQSKTSQNLARRKTIAGTLLDPAS